MQFKQLRIEAWKSQDFNGDWTQDLAIPVRRSNQLSYEAIVAWIVAQLVRASHWYWLTLDAVDDFHKDISHHQQQAYLRTHLQMSSFH